MKKDVIFLSGMLEDAQGRYDSDASYIQVPWSIHTPKAIGDDPAIFIGIAHGGVIVTGMPGTKGADLLAFLSPRIYSVGL